MLILTLTLLNIFGHLASAAFFAIFCRSSNDNFSARDSTPFSPPSRPANFFDNFGFIHIISESFAQKNMPIQA
jgi:hypothetical protein